MSSSVEARALRGARTHLGKNPGERSKKYGIWYVTEHRLLTMKQYFMSILMGSVFNPVMYLFALGIGIGSYIDRSSGNAMAGVSYLTFVGPALLASAALNAANDETSFPVMGGFRWTREFFSMNATPLAPWQITGGVLLAAAIRVVLTVMVFWLFLWLFGASPSNFGFLAIFSSVLAGLSFGSLMMAVASAIDDDDGWFALINRMVVAPMFLFSGTFYPLELMPSWLHWIGWVSPLWHGTELGRAATFGLAISPLMIVVHLGVLVCYFFLGLTFSNANFARRLAK